MLILILCAVQLASTFDTTQYYDCGRSNYNNTRRIVGGTEVHPHAYPWTAALTFRGVYYCTSNIITDRHVLTAGHCVVLKNLENPSIFILMNVTDMHIMIGVHNRQDGNGTAHTVKTFRLHARYYTNAKRGVNDIAIIKTVYSMIFNSFSIRPICLPEPGMNIIHRMLTVSGWGTTQFGRSNGSRYLMSAEVRVISSENCKKIDYYRNEIRPSMICAFESGKDACQGDSGGGLIGTHEKTFHQIYYIFGITSWGYRCGQANFPGVYTNVTYYLDWIKNTLKEI